MKIRRYLALLLAGAVILSGCGLPSVKITMGGADNPAETEQPVLIPETGGQEEAEPADPQPVPTELVPEEPLETPAPETPPAVEHIASPVEPSGKYQTIHDQTSDRYAGENRAYSGDEFKVGRYERSFLQDMTYLPFIDILKAEMNREGSDWIYVRIQVMSDPLNNREDNPLFGVELDVDVNNRGEYLILAAVPEGGDWTTDGVRVWHDLDSDIGGSTPVKPDDSGGDGYEDLVFDGGQGDDPDLAWVRVSPEGPEYVEIAFKRGLLAGEELGKEKFIWLPWAITGFADQTIYEFNDHFTFEEAGSPMREHEGYYPLRELWGVDNTCRGTSGMVPQYSMTGACANYDPPPSRPGATNVPPPPEPIIPIIK